MMHASRTLVKLVIISVSTRQFSFLRIPALVAIHILLSIMCTLWPEIVYRGIPALVAIHILLSIMCTLWPEIVYRG